MLISADYGSIAAVFGAPGQDELWSDVTFWPGVEVDDERRQTPLRPFALVRGAGNPGARACNLEPAQAGRTRQTAARS